MEYDIEYEKWSIQTLLENFVDALIDDILLLKNKEYVCNLIKEDWIVLGENFRHEHPSIKMIVSKLNRYEVERNMPAVLFFSKTEKEFLHDYTDTAIKYLITWGELQDAKALLDLVPVLSVSSYPELAGN